MILADTSVWIHHFRERNDSLIRFLEADQILMHPFIIGELACGNLRNRRELIQDLEALPGAVIASHSEVMEFIERYAIFGKGIGLIDGHLLASSALSQALLWTHDLSLRRIAFGLEIGFRET